MLRKGDKILLATLMVIIAGSFGGFEIYKKIGTDSYKIAVIKQNDKVIRRIDLESVVGPQEITVTGDYTDVVLVERGRIRFRDANCPDLICVKTGWLTKKGDMAVCLPNRTIVIIEGENEKVDGVAQ